jgi:hypothetical protein
MKKILGLFLLSYSISTTGYCQLLNKPSLTVQDFETALTNSDHLSKILKLHNFKHSASGASKFKEPGAMPNPLFPDLRVLRSENWVPGNPEDKYAFNIDIYEWEPNHSPQPDAIKTISIMVKKDSKYAGQMRAFLEIIKNRYPNESKRYFRDNDFFKQYGEPLIVFTNGSNIEVRTEVPDARYGQFYTVSFDLLK